jgi:Tfp pilus assembly protein PilN
MIKINLLPTEGPGPSKVYVELIAGIGLIVIAAAGIAFYWNYLNGIIQNRQDEIVAKTEQVKKLQNIIDQVKKYEEQKQKLETKLKMIKDMRENQQGPVILLDKLSRYVPDNVWFNKLASTSGKLNLSGLALSMMSIGDLLKELGTQASDLFPNVRLIDSKMQKIMGREIYSFQIELQYAAKKAADLMKKDAGPAPGAAPATPGGAPAPSPPPKS